ncbi:G-D-S-L family lipolytic protein, partial [Sesbania bispinosa]
VGIYVVIGTIINVFGNEQWLDLLSYCQVYANNLCPFCFTSSPYKLLPSRQGMRTQSCSHPTTHDECFKAMRFCVDPEILRIYAEGDLYSLLIWKKATITTALKDFAASDDSFFESDNIFRTTSSLFRYVFNNSRDCEASSSGATV